MHDVRCSAVQLSVLQGVVGHSPGQGGSCSGDVASLSDGVGARVFMSGPCKLNDYESQACLHQQAPV